MQTRGEGQVGKGPGHIEVRQGFCSRRADEWKPGFKQKVYETDGPHMLWIRLIQPPEIFQAPVFKMKEEVLTILLYYILAFIFLKCS